MSNRSGNRKKNANLILKDIRRTNISLRIVYDKTYPYLSTYFSIYFFFLFNFKALFDKQRHHVCEGPCSLGYALQICRADEHPNAFQVTEVREKDRTLNSASSSLSNYPFFFFKEKMLL